MLIHYELMCSRPRIGTTKRTHFDWFNAPFKSTALTTKWYCAIDCIRANDLGRKLWHFASTKWINYNLMLNENNNLPIELWCAFFPNPDNDANQPADINTQKGVREQSSMQHTAVPSHKTPQKSNECPPVDSLGIQFHIFFSIFSFTEH